MNLLKTHTSIFYIAIFALLVGLLSFSVIAPVFADAKEQNDNFSRVFISFDKTVGKQERALVRAHSGKIKYSYSIVDAVVAQMPTHAIDGLSRNPHVTSIELDQEVEAIDIELDNSWGVKSIGGGDVHSTYSNKGAGVSIGIIDSGINYNHPELDDNYQGGYDFYYYDLDPMDVYGHGTHVAATACGEDNNNGNTNPKLGVVGVAPECDLYSLRVLNEDGVGYFSDIVAAVEWATGAEVYLEAWGDTTATSTQGVKLDVVNLSLGKDAYPGQVVEDAFQNAYDQGLLIVAAAGNSGNKGGKNESTIYPAKFSSVIAVGATDNKDKRARFSSTGVDVELTAPGVDVYSAWNDDTPYYGTATCNDSVDECYKYGSGTSMASPHVAGTAALMIAAGMVDHNGDTVIDNKDVRLVLQNTAIDLGDSGRDIQYGYGLVDALLAVGTAGADTNNAPVADAGSNQTVIDTDANGTENVTLDASGSYDPDGTITSYNWYEGVTWIASGSTPTLTLRLGNYTFILQVADNEGSTANDTVQISVVSESDGGGNNCPPGKAKRELCTP